MYLHELRAHRKGLIGWSIGMFVLILLSMNKFATLSSTKGAATDLINKFPHTVQVIFGFTGLDIGSVLGYFGTVYLYVLLMAGVYAAMRGADLIAKEERDQTAEFLLPKPVSRDAIVSTKIFAALTQVGVFWLVTVASSFGLMAAYAKGANFVSALWLMMVAILLIMLVFLFVGMAIAAFVQRPKLAVTLASSTVLAAYIISVVINIAGNLDWLNFITPINYFPAATIVNDHMLDLHNIILSTIIILTMALLTFIGYAKREV
jgi:ABC-2 type transport system permease protein